MTTFGIEWDTHALLYPSDGKYDDSQDKVLNPSNISNVQFSIEGWDAKEKIFKEEKNQQLESNIDCFKSLEIIMGIFHGNEKSFNIQEFLETCEEFKIRWNEILESRKININNKEYQLLTYFQTTDEKSEYIPLSFKNCKRDITGYIKEDSKYFGYINQLQKIKGVPQITFGVRLKYIVNLFQSFYNFITINNNQNIPATVKRILISYQISRYQLGKLAPRENFLGKINSKKADDDILNLFSFILLCNYFLITIILPAVSYKKALFLFKLRSNLRYIYDTIISEKYKELLKNDWKNLLIESIQKNPENFDNNLELIEKILYKIETFWKGVFEDNNEFVKLATILDPNDLRLVRSYDQQKNTIKVYSHFRKNVPEILDNGKLNTDDVYNFDIGEWRTHNDIVFLELRNLDIFDMLEEDRKQIKHLISSDNLCSYIQEVLLKLQTFLWS